MNDTYKPAEFLTINANGTRIDWPATNKKVIAFVKQHAQSNVTGAFEAADILADLKKLVKRYGVKTIIAALKMDSETKAREQEQKP